MFQATIKQLIALDNTELQIQAKGNYPVKRKTKVAAVAVYQNDGTANIKPSKFVERAEKRNRSWIKPLELALRKILWRRGDSKIVLNIVGTRIARDIAKVCDRIDTRRLKKSFAPKVIEK